MVNLLSPASGVRILLQKTFALLNHREEAIRPIASEERRAAIQALQHQERALPSTSLGILFPSPVQEAIVVHQISAVMSDVAEADAIGRKLKATLSVPAASERCSDPLVSDRATSSPPR